MLGSLAPLVCAALCAAVPSRAEPAGVPDFSGVWRGRATRAGSSAEIVLELTPDESGALGARLSLPTIGAWSFPVGTAVPEESGLRIGSFALSHDAAGDTLSGTLPASLVPVHRIPVTLRRGDPPRPPPVAGLQAPRVAPVWAVQTGGPVWAAPAWADGIVYAGSDDGRLRALDAATGRELWSVATGGAIRARPALRGELLYVPSDDGVLYALGRADGAERWRRRLSEPQTRVPPGAEGSRYDHYASSVAVGGEALFLGGADGVLHALAPDSGRVLWRFAAEDAIRGTPATDAGRVFFGSFDGRVYAVDAATGESVWTRDTGAPVVSAPAVDAGRVVIGSRSYDLFGLDASSGAVDWTVYYWFSWVESSATVGDGVAYLGSSDAGTVRAVETATGDVLWETRVGGSAWAQPALSDAAVFVSVAGVDGYIVDHRGGFYALDRRSGRPLWQYPAEPGGGSPWGFASSPSAGGELVYVGTLDGRILAFSQRLAAP